MGLALLANLSALDFGYISTGQLIERTTNALATMETLARYRGHFYNWYDTQSLKPLPPRYVSTVDSGNLAAHLLTLRQGLLALPDQRIVPAGLFKGSATPCRSSWRRWKQKNQFLAPSPGPLPGGKTEISANLRSISEGPGVSKRFPADNAHGCAALP